MRKRRAEPAVWIAGLALFALAAAPYSLSASAAEGEKKAEPKVKWIETHTGIEAQQALSEKVKQAKIARRTPVKKSSEVEEQ